jgi:hypothetical protein
LLDPPVEGITDQRAPSERVQLVRPFEEVLPGHALHLLRRDDDGNLLVAFPQLVKNGQAAFGLSLRDDLVVGPQPPLERSLQLLERLAILIDQKQNWPGCPLHTDDSPSQNAPKLPHTPTRSRSTARFRTDSEGRGADLGGISIILVGIIDYAARL